jgi:hypothetical protein
MQRLALVSLLLGLLLAPPALGDADPASDVLLGENVFYPYNPAVTRSLQARLNGIVNAAHKARFPIRVALIATPVDLGAVPTFFGKPRQYAAFLDQEISFGGRVPLLVVMPDGYGSAGLSSGASDAVAALPRPTGATANALARAAVLAVASAAAVAGHSLAGSGASVTPGSGRRLLFPAAVLAATCVALAAGILAVRRRRRRASGAARRP